MRFREWFRKNEEKMEEWAWDMVAEEAWNEALKEAVKVIDECIDKPKGIIPDSVYNLKALITNH